MNRNLLAKILKGIKTNYTVTFVVLCILKIPIQFELYKNKDFIFRLFCKQQKAGFIVKTAGSCNL